MNCCQCEELIAAAARDGQRGRPNRRVENHLAGCTSCREFRAQVLLVSIDLEGWQAPIADSWAVATCTATLIARFQAAGPLDLTPGITQPSRRRESLQRAAQHPGLIGVLGAAAMAAGAAVAPAWLQQVAIGWAACAVVAASLVLLFHARPLLCEGERI